MCDTLRTLSLALRSRTEPHYSWPSLPSSPDIPMENAHHGFQRPGQKESPHRQFQDHTSKTHTHPPMLFLEAWVHDAAGVTQSVTGIWERRETLRGTWRMTTSGWTITLLLLTLSSSGECKHTQTHTGTIRIRDASSQLRWPTGWSLNCLEWIHQSLIYS